jgi:integrase
VCPRSTLSGETIRKYENLLERRFLPWCEHHGYRQFKQMRGVNYSCRPADLIVAAQQMTVDALRGFQTTWDDGPLYATKNLERLRAFFEFALEAQWLSRNPVNSLKRPKATDAPTLPFTDEEMTRILDACDRYPGNQDRMKAFVLVMRYSGLRIGDTISLDKSRLNGNKLLLYTAKTGTPVYIPLPAVVTEALDKLGTNNGRYFSTGNAKPQTARANWSRYLDTVLELAEVENGGSAPSLVEKRSGATLLRNDG